MFKLCGFCCFSSLLFQYLFLLKKVFINETIYFDMLDFFQFLSIRKFKLFGNPEDYPCVLADLVNPSALDRVFSQLEKKSLFRYTLLSNDVVNALNFFTSSLCSSHWFSDWAGLWDTSCSDTERSSKARWGNATCTWRSKFSQTLFKPSMRRYYKTKGPTPFSKGKLSRNDEKGGFLERSSQ